MSELETKNEPEIETDDFTDDELSDEALDREGAKVCSNPSNCWCRCR